MVEGENRHKEALSADQPDHPYLLPINSGLVDQLYQGTARGANTSLAKGLRWLIKKEGIS